jgi:hypothetical protein
MPRAGPGRSLRDVALALAAALLVILAGLLVMPGGESSVTTRTSAVLLPSASIDPADQANYYELLSQGTITGSAAELLRQPRLLTSAAEATPGAVAEELRTSVVVVPDTAVLRLEVVGPSAQVTARVSAAIMRTWRSEIRSTFPAYTVLVFGTDTKPSERSLLLPLALHAAVLAAAALTGGAVYLLLQRLAGRRIQGLQRAWNAVRPSPGGAADEEPDHALRVDAPSPEGSAEERAEQRRLQRT